MEVKMLRLIRNARVCAAPWFNYFEPATLSFTYAVINDTTAGGGHWRSPSGRRGKKRRRRSDHGTINVLEMRIYFNIPGNGSDADEGGTAQAPCFHFFPLHRHLILIMKSVCLDCEIEINARLQVGKIYSFWLSLTGVTRVALSSCILLPNSLNLDLPFFLPVSLFLIFIIISFVCHFSILQGIFTPPTFLLILSLLYAL